jgi:hypothetical protein
MDEPIFDDTIEDMSIRIDQPPISVPGRGLDGFFSVAKHAMTTLVNLMTAVVTQSSSVTQVIPKLTPTKIREIGRRTYLDDTIRRAEEQPQQMFKTPIQAVNAAGEEPAVVAARRAANAFETVASHNGILLLVSVCIMVYLMYSHADVLFGTIGSTLSTGTSGISTLLGGTT